MRCKITSLGAFILEFVATIILIAWITSSINCASTGFTLHIKGINVDGSKMEIECKDGTIDREQLKEIFVQAQGNYVYMYLYDVLPFSVINDIHDLGWKLVATNEGFFSQQYYFERIDTNESS